jgi:hypothetical protein
MEKFIHSYANAELLLSGHLVSMDYCTQFCSTKYLRNSYCCGVYGQSRSAKVNGIISMYLGLQPYLLYKCGLSVFSKIRPNALVDYRISFDAKQCSMFLL